jgi:hypothetical protein
VTLAGRSKALRDQAELLCWEHEVVTGHPPTRLPGSRSVLGYDPLPQILKEPNLCTSHPPVSEAASRSRGQFSVSSGEDHSAQFVLAPCQLELAPVRGCVRDTPGRESLHIAPRTAENAKRVTGPESADDRQFPIVVRHTVKHRSLPSGRPSPGTR